MHTSNIAHSFHIPVLGLAFSIDTPVKVARFGISSVMSIMDDQLIEQMREYHSLQAGRSYIPIAGSEPDWRARRITAYLDLIGDIVAGQMAELRALPFEEGNDLMRYFELLPEASPLKAAFHRMQAEEDAGRRLRLQQSLREEIVPGSIDVNIMAKVDRLGIDKGGMALPSEQSDALAALRGYANSSLSSALVLSAGYNPRLYAYAEQFADFFPDAQGQARKKIILKVSDYRSALVQGKLFAKRGLWISEFRIESGLNCGGHAFATDGLLLGPILEEFRQNRAALRQELLDICREANAAKGRHGWGEPDMRITVQGGIGTAGEHEYLMAQYGIDGCGWGSPFLLVPEATNVDEETLQALAGAEQDDYYLSHASPLGVPFNNFRKSSSERQRLARIAKGRPGSPCYKKFLSSDTEFTTTPICAASREYQHLKLNQLKERVLSAEAYAAEFRSITEKDCLCEGLGAAALLTGNMKISHKLSAVAICPGPNLAYFSGIFSLSDMAGHIYGRRNLLNGLRRPHMFINELNLYVDYLQKKIAAGDAGDARLQKYVQTFRLNLLKGISYYKGLLPDMAGDTAGMRGDLERIETGLLSGGA